MKKLIFLLCLMIFSLSISTVSAANSNRKAATDNPIAVNNKENKLSEEEVMNLTRRVEQIRDMDKTNLSFTEKRDLRKELKGIKENLRQNGTYIYVSVGTLILIIVLILILV